MEWCRVVASSGGHCLWTLDVEIDYDGILTASCDHSFTGFVGEGVDLLVRYVGRNINEVARASFTAEFQVISPSHADPAAAVPACGKAGANTVQGCNLRRRLACWPGLAKAFKISRSF